MIIMIQPNDQITPRASNSEERAPKATVRERRLQEHYKRSDVKFPPHSLHEKDRVSQSHAQSPHRQEHELRENPTPIDQTL